MAKNIDSFDMDKWSKGKKEKAEKPVKEKKEKETSFDMDDSSSFNVEKFEKKPKKEKAEKPIKEEKETSFEVKEKKSKTVKVTIDDKNSGFDISSPKNGRKNKNGDFSEFDEKEKKPSKIKALFKKLTKNKPVFIIVCTILSLVLLAGTLFLLDMIRYNKDINHISIENMPDKVIYYVGDELDITGLKIVAVQNNGKIKDVDISECTITGFDSSKSAEYQKITVRYLDYFVSFNIVVNEKIKPTPILSRIEMETLPKTEYKLGDRFDAKGGVIRCYYSDGSSFLVSLVSSYVSGYRTIDAPGVYDLTVRYEKDGDEAFTTYTITVTE